MAAVAQLSMRQHAQRLTWFVTVQLIALIGWIIVQSTFTLSPLGHGIPFVVIMVVETIWWIATLVIMFVLFRRLYTSFIQAAVDLEDANKRLRDTTNSILTEMRTHGQQGPGETNVGSA
jgi:hypothetical protein